MKWLHFDWRELLARLPLPTLALAASWGVYQFNLLFLPAFFAVVSAASFELVYIALSAISLTRISRISPRALIRRPLRQRSG